MKNIILFFGSFDPLHKGHISIMENAIEKVNADYIYLGLNKSSSKGKLTSLFHRRNMINLILKESPKYRLLPFSFDYINLDKTYNNIFSLIRKNTNYYILVGQDQLNSLKNWYKYGEIVKKFKFIIAKRGNQVISDEDLNNPNYIFIDHDYKSISSKTIKDQEYSNTYSIITNYIINYNLYLKSQIKQYLDEDRYNHTLSVAKTALYINKKAKLGLNPYDVEKAALLHDIAKNLKKDKAYNILQSNYPCYIHEEQNIIHQYIGQLLAKENFHVHNDDILNAIKYHTTGRKNMSLLEKLIFVSDKIEPSRNYDTSELMKNCLNNFENGFKLVLKNNKEYLERKNISVTNKDTLECYKYYLIN